MLLELGAVGRALDVLALDIEEHIGFQVEDAGATDVRLQTAACPPIDEINHALNDSMGSGLTPFAMLEEAAITGTFGPGSARIGAPGIETY